MERRECCKKTTSWLYTCLCTFFHVIVLDQHPLTFSWSLAITTRSNRQSGAHGMSCYCSAMCTYPLLVRFTLLFTGRIHASPTVSHHRIVELDQSWTVCDTLIDNATSGHTSALHAAVEGLCVQEQIKNIHAYRQNLLYKTVTLDCRVLRVFLLYVRFVLVWKVIAVVLLSCSKVIISTSPVMLSCRQRGNFWMEWVALIYKRKISRIPVIAGSNGQQSSEIQISLIKLLLTAWRYGMKRNYGCVLTGRLSALHRVGSVSGCIPVSSGNARTSSYFTEKFGW